MPKCIGNRFAFHRPICSYAGLPVVPLGSKVLWLIVALVTSHHLAFLVGLHIYVIIFSCSTTTKLFPLIPPLEQVVPTISIVAASHGCACDVHCFGGGNALLLAWNPSNFVGYGQEMETNSPLVLFSVMGYHVKSL